MSVKDVKKMFAISNLVVAALVALVLVLNAFYVVQEQEQAVVVTWGRANVITTPGPHFKIPFIQKVEIVPMVISGLSIGYTSDSPTTPEEDTSLYDESMMITSDYNFVNVDFFLEYQVSDPERYLFASNNPEFILKNLALSYIRDTIGLHGVDEVITTGKNEIQAEIKQKLTERLEKEDIGLHLINITIQDAEPPTTEVKDAFKNVETAKQDKETAINTARKYESEQIPAARASVDAIMREAESNKESRFNEAKAQVAVFNAMFDEYVKNPQMTRQRMFYETMEELLPHLKIVIDSGDGTTSRMLPLEPFTAQSPLPAPPAASTPTPEKDSEEAA